MKPITSFNEISIPTPCHENWENMTSEEKGRFCTVCNKTVHDFSHSNLEQINAVLQEKQGESICVRLSKKQLEKPTFAVRVTKALRYFALALALVFGVHQKAHAQLHEKPKEVKEVHLTTTGGIAGKITDRNSDDALNNITISVFHDQKYLTGIRTNKQGEYNLVGLIPGSYTLVFSGKEYHSLTTQNILIKASTVQFNATLEKAPIREEDMLMGVMPPHRD